MIFILSLTFGPTVGGVAGGLGSSLSDAFAAPQYAPYTFVIKGIEGYISGYVSKRGFRGSTGTAWLLASIEMVAGYFIAESLAITGYPVSLACVPVDILQVSAGGIVGIPVAQLLKTRLPSWLVYLSGTRPPKPGKA